MEQFTVDWFDRCIPSWEKHLFEFKDKADLRFLEIGSYEGRSTLWLLNNILTNKTSRITCIDIFEDAAHQNTWSKELYDKYNMSEVLCNFKKNTKSYQDKIDLHIGYSQKILRTFDPHPMFPTLKDGAILIFDDYAWKMFDNPLRHPGIGVDAFLAVYKDRYDLLEKDQQVILRKKALTYC